MLAGLSQLHAAFPAQPSCVDKHQQCPNWAFAGQCDVNQGFMKVQCAQSCDSCGWGPGMLSPVALRVAPADEAQLMRTRAAGTCAAAPADALRWGADPAMAALICCHNRKGAASASNPSPSPSPNPNQHTPQSLLSAEPAPFDIPRGGRRAEPLRVIAHDVRSFHPGQVPSRRALGRRAASRVRIQTLRRFGSLT